MAHHFFFLFALLSNCGILFAQQDSSNAKGVSAIRAIPLNSLGETYAVVVGISDYQDPEITDLRFADKDAEAFANFLRSVSGGNLNNDHLKLLINSNATMAQFANALDWLWENVKEGDQAIIYYSGHGDVEKKSFAQPGYLLCWDAPSRVYLAGGALALPMFQDVISTLSVQNKAKVIVITDACRSGKLSGSSIGGSQITGANMSRQFANEIKILSCQPNEFSIEGEQWGGGRGAFSYHLVNALYGMADQNNDLVVNLQEVARYLEDRVTKEVAPVSQIPMIIGNRIEKLSSVNALALLSIQSGKSNDNNLFSAIDSRGIEEDLMAQVNDQIKLKYNLFKNAIRDKKFFNPSDSCADIYYEQLIHEPSLKALHSTMRRNYAAALQDDAQQVMNKWLKAEVFETALSTKTKLNKYEPYPQYLNKAAELLGEQHFMYPHLMARMHFFKVYLLTVSSKNPDSILGAKALVEFRKALDWEPDLPVVYWQMSNVYGYQLFKPDSAELYGQKAMDLQPSWVLPCTNLGFLFSEKYKMYEKAKFYLEVALTRDSSSAFVWNNLGNYYRMRKDYLQAEENYKKAIQLDSNLIFPYSNLGLMYRYTKQFDEGKRMLKKAIDIDSSYANAHNTLGMIYLENKQYEDSKHHLIKALNFDSTLVFPYINLGLICSYTDQWDEAEFYYLKAVELDSTIANTFYNLACLYSKKNEFEKALLFLEKNFLAGDDDYEYLMQDPDLKVLRERPEWYSLIDNYFPKYKHKKRK